MSKVSPKARNLASVIGKIMYMSLAIGPVSWLMTRSMYALLNSRQYWDQPLSMTPEVKAELQFWNSQLKLINGKEIWHSPSAIRVVYSDASATGYGGFTVEHGCHAANGAWSEEEMAQSSTWRELKAMQKVLESLLPKLKNEQVRWFSDNQNVVRILNIGSKKPHLQKEALAVFSLAAQNLICIEPEWIPRTENQQADYLSRIEAKDDWIIHPAIFASIDLQWGPHSVIILQITSIPSYPNSILGSGVRVQKLLMPSPATGGRRLTGSALRHTWSPGPSDMPQRHVPRVH